MSINRIMIRNLEPQYNAEYIANYFWKKEIAKVSSVTILPYILNFKILGIAYIVFDSFCETEAASEFIYNMTGVAGFMMAHAEPEDDNIWLLEPNTHNEGDLCVGSFTTVFDSKFFSNEDDELFVERPINCFNDSYTVDEAISYLWVLSLQWEQETDSEKKQRIAKEIYEIDSKTKAYLVMFHNEMSPTTIDYSEDLSAVMTEMMELEWKSYMLQQLSLPPPERQTNRQYVNAEYPVPLLPEDEYDDFPLPPPPRLQREVAMSVDEYNILGGHFN